jgi:hypothetical protein
MILNSKPIFGKIGTLEISEITVLIIGYLHGMIILNTQFNERGKKYAKYFVTKGKIKGQDIITL